MNDELKIKMYAFTLDCKEPQELAKFYATLMNWEVMVLNDNFTCVYAPGSKHGGYPMLLFQRNTDYVPPVWPEEPKAQQQMAHLDFAVSDIKKAVEHAVACGARVSQQQFSDSWTVMFDPVGHPFCLCEMKSLMESPDFALL